MFFSTTKQTILKNGRNGALFSKPACQKHELESLNFSWHSGRVGAEERGGGGGGEEGGERKKEMYMRCVCACV